MAFIPSAPIALTSSLSHVCGQQPERARALPRPNTSHESGRVTTIAMAATRKFMVGGNWKCNLSKSTIANLVKSLNAGPALDDASVEVVIAPPSVYLDSTRTVLRPDFATCGQNAWTSAGGAFTGELDASMISDVGASWVLLGHSERRNLPEIKESDDTIATKAAYALNEVGLNVIYCIGELLEEHDAGQSVAVCERQLTALGNAISDWSNVVIAYEPVWAIGTGKVATPEQAEDVQKSVRNWIAKNVSQDVADSTRILYGGSVSPANCGELAKQPNVDGFLVGGASLKTTFLEIVDSYKAALAGAV